MANQDGQSRWPTKMAESVGTLLFKLFVLVLRLSPLKGGGWDKAVNVPLYALSGGAEAMVQNGYNTGCPAKPFTLLFLQFLGSHGTQSKKCGHFFVAQLSQKFTEIFL